MTVAPARIIAFLVVAAAGAAALSPEVALAQPELPDEVRLRDGSFFRGTLIESSRQRVVISLPSGETRTFGTSEVLSAGARPPHGPITRVHATTDVDGLSLHRRTGSTRVHPPCGLGGARPVDEFAVICMLPCDVELRAGRYQLALARGSGQPVRTGPLTLREGDLHLDVHYENREELRIAGWITWIAGMALGAVLAVTSMFTGARSCSPIGYCRTEINIPQLIAGGVIFGIGVAVGTPLAFFGDHADVQISH